MPVPRSSAFVHEFEALGLNETEERAYRALLDCPGVTPAQASKHLNVTAQRLRLAFAALESKGLATRSLAKPHRYFPVAPELALDALISKRSDELAHARAAAERLSEQAKPSTAVARTKEHVLEILDNRESALRAIARMQKRAKHECLCLDKPPYVIGPPGMVDPSEIEGLSRGVAYRNLIDIEAFNFPGVVERVRTCVNAGETVRVTSRLPLKLLIADDRIGIIPVNPQNPAGPVLLLRSSSLLDTLREYFELLWQQATPIAFSRTGELKSAEGSIKLPVDMDQLIPRLAAGANDKAIAHDLGLSPRTFDRRIDEFMKNLNARTRFQAGWLAAHKFAARADQ